MSPEFHQLASLLAAQAPAPGCGGGEQYLLFALMFAIVYFVWLRPASREQKQQAEMLKNLKRGDRVLTRSGIFGTVADKTEKTVTIEIAPKVKVEMLLSAIGKAIKPNAPDTAPKRDAKKEPKKDPKKEPAAAEAGKNKS